MLRSPSAIHQVRSRRTFEKILYSPPFLEHFVEASYHVSVVAALPLVADVGRPEAVQHVEALRTPLLLRARNFGQLAPLREREPRVLVRVLNVDVARESAPDANLRIQGLGIGFGGFGVIGSFVP